MWKSLETDRGTDKAPKFVCSYIDDFMATSLDSIIMKKKPANLFLNTGNKETYWVNSYVCEWAFLYLNRNNKQDIWYCQNLSNLY